MGNIDRWRWRHRRGRVQARNKQDNLGVDHPRLGIEKIQRIRSRLNTIRITDVIAVRNATSRFTLVGNVAMNNPFLLRQPSTNPGVFW